VADRTLKVTIIGDAGSAVGALSQTELAAGSLEQKVGGVSGALATLGPAFLGIGAATAGLFGTAIVDAANFEQTMSGVKAAAGDAAVPIDRLRQLALDMGAQTSFSAGEAATAMQELLKGGVSPLDIELGALEATLGLAAAGSLSLESAATITANALAIFGLDGAEAARVADTFAAAAGASTISVEDLQETMKYVGPIAAAMGISIEDAAAATAALGAAGITGSQAGTALRTMLTSLSAPSKEAATLMKELGINVFDSQGKFIGLDGAAGELQTALKGMSDAQKIATLETLFGKEGMTAALVVMNEGEAGMQNWTNLVTDQGAAQRIAATNLDNFKGSMEALKGSLETVAIVLGSMLLPHLRTLAEFATTLVNAFLGLNPEMQQTIAAVVGIAGAVAGAIGVWGVFGPQITAAAQAFAFLATTLGGPLLIAAAAAGALWFAWENNFLGIRDRVNEAAAAFQALAAPLADQVWAEAVATWDRLVVAAGNLEDALTQSGPPADAFRAVLYLIADVLPALTGPIDTLIGQFERLRQSGDPLAAVLGDIRDYATSLYDRVRDLDLSWRDLTTAFSTGSTVLTIVAGILGGPLTVALGAIAIATGALYLAWTEDWGGIRGAVEPVMATLTQLAAWVTGTAIPAFQQFGATLLGIWQGEIVPLAQQFAAVIQGGVGGAMAALIPLVQQFGAAFQANMPALIQLWDQLKQTFAAVQPILEPLAYFLGGVVVVQIGFLMGALGGLVGFLTGALPGAIKAAEGVLMVLEGAFTIVSAAVKGMVDVVSALLRGDFAGAFEAAKQAVDTAMAGTRTIVEGLVTAVVGIIGGLGSGVLGALQGFWNTVIGFFQGVYKELVGESIIPDLINKIVEWFGKLPGMVLAALGDLANTLYQKGRDLIGGFLAGVGEAWGTVATNFANVGVSVIGYVGDVARALWQKGVDIVDGFTAGVWDKWQWVVTFFGDVGGSVLGFIGDTLQTLYEKGKDLGTGLINGVKDALAGLKDIVIAALNEVIVAYNNLMPGTQFDLPTIGGGGGTTPAPGGGGTPTPLPGGGGGSGMTEFGFPIGLGGGAGGGGVTLIVNNYGLTVPEVAQQLHSALAQLLDGGGGATTAPGTGPITVN
jgi:TP901 family phage tail tape measure protein